MISNADKRVTLDLVNTEMVRQRTYAENGRFEDAWRLGQDDLRRLTILAEEFGEAAKETCELMHILDKPFPGEDPILVADCKRRASIRLKLRLHAELIQVAAVAASWATVLLTEVDVLSREKFEKSTCACMGDCSCE
jgi:hypothetical protein